MPILTAQERIGTTLDRKYRLDRIIGEGGMGVVYAAHHLRLDRRVAVKFLHPQYAQDTHVVSRFFAEAQAAARIHHPNIVEIYDLDHAQDDASAYMVLEFLDGEPLGAFLRRRVRIGPGEALDLIGPALDALGRAHEHGIIHRDLKPDNIFLIHEPGGRLIPKVLDFGIAKLAGAKGSGSTSTGQVVGTPAYMAPEQAMGRKDIGPWTDVWSMAIVLYEALTGNYPFEFTEDMPATAMLVTILSTPARPLTEAWPEAPADLAYAIDRALAKEPSQRWQSMSEFRAALEGRPIEDAATVIAAGPLQLRAQLESTMMAEPAPRRPQSPQPTPLTRFHPASPTPYTMGAQQDAAPPKPSTKRPWILGAGALLAVLLIGVAALVTGGSPEPIASSTPPSATIPLPPAVAAPVGAPATLVAVDEPALVLDAGLLSVATTPSIPLGVEIPDEAETRAPRSTPTVTQHRETTRTPLTVTRRSVAEPPRASIAPPEPSRIAVPAPRPTETLVEHRADRMSGTEF